MRQRKVEVVNKLTEAQIRDARIAELEECINQQRKYLLEIRAQVIELRKDLASIQKKELSPKRKEKAKN
jgi:uncharacterized coiled-coil protein SlyX